MTKEASAGSLVSGSVDRLKNLSSCNLEPIPSSGKPDSALSQVRDLWPY